MAAPALVQIDASSHCQLACPSCPTAEGLVAQHLGAGHLNPDHLAALLTANPSIHELELSNYGEMLLNPRLPELLAIATAHNVVVHADNGVNFNHAPDSALEAIVRHRVRSMTFSIDGASADSYPQYRVKGSFDKVIANIRRLNDEKRRQRSAFPLLKWQFVVFGHNEHELPTARKLAAELGMQFFPKLSWDDHVSPIRNPEFVQIQLCTPNLTRAQHLAATGQDYQRQICTQLWHAPVLNWDGRLNGCCRNFWGDFGANAFTSGLSTALAHPNFLTAKRMLLGQAEPEPGIPCTTCDLYTTLRSTGHWLTKSEIEATAPKGHILLGIVINPGISPATHVDLFITHGHQVDRTLFVKPPAASRVALDQHFAAHLPVPGPGDYLLYALPRQIDPTYRTRPPRLPEVTLPLTIPALPTRQEFTLSL